MDHHQESALSKVQKGIWRSILLRYVHEQSLPYAFVFASLTTYFVWCCLVMLSMNTNFAFLSDIVSKHHHLIIILCGTACLIVILLKPLAAVTMESKSRISHLYARTSAFTTLGFVYNVYPLMIWAYSSLICAVVRKEQTLLFLALATVLVALATLLCAVELATRNNVPSRFQLSAISRHTEFVLFLCTSAVIIGSQPLAKTKNQHSKIIACVLTDIVLLGGIVLVWNSRLYWHRTISQHYSFCYALIVIIKIFAEYSSFSSKASFIIFSSLLLPLIYKLNSILCSKALMINIQESGISNFNLALGCLLCHLYLVEGISTKSSASDKDVYMHFMGVWRNREEFKTKSKGNFREELRKRDRAKEIEKKNFGKMANHEIEDSQDIDPNNLVGYLIKLLATRNPTVNIIRAITVLCLIYPQPNLKVLDAILPHLLSNLRKKSTRSKLSDLDSYHYSTLITTCLTRNYRELQTSTDVSKRTYYNLYDSGREIMEDVDCSSHTHADIASVFTRIKEHRRTVELMCAEIEGRQNIFESLLNESCSSVKKLYSINQKCRSLHDEIRSQFKIFKSLKIEQTPSYQYCAFIFYYFDVRRNLQLANSLLKQYKLKLNLIASKVECDMKFTKDDDFMCNTATLQISLNSTDLGRIQYASLNFFEFLGTPPEVNIDFHNISELLPEAIASKHKSAMRDFCRLQYGIDHPPQAFVVGFDGYLRSTVVRVKTIPDLSDGISAVCSLTFDLADSSQLVLTDADLQIIAAEKGFWHMLDPIGNSSLTSLCKISSDLMSAAKLIFQYNNLVSKYSAEKIKELSISSETVAEMMRAVCRVVECNQEGALVIELKKGSEYWDKISENKVMVKISMESYLKAPLLKFKFMFAGRFIDNQHLSISQAKGLIEMDMKDQDDASSQMQQKSSRLIKGRSTFVGPNTAVLVVPRPENSIKTILAKAVDLIPQWKDDQMNRAKSLTAGGFYEKCQTLYESKQEIRQFFCVLQEMQLAQTVLGNIVQVADSSREEQEEVPCSLIELKSKFSPDRAGPYEPKDGLLNLRASLMDLTPVNNIRKKLITKNYQNRTNFASLAFLNSDGSQTKVFFNDDAKLRLKNDKVQQMLADNSNVVIASSNSIAKILNKVMVDMN